MFKYPNNIIETIKNNWYHKTSHEENVTSLPDDKTLSILLEISYHASLLAEESRRIGFRITYISKKDVIQKIDDEKKVESFPHLQNSLRPIYFENEREFNVNEILRLAPATEFIQSLICVEQTNKSKTNSKLVIWGILDIGSSWYKFIHGESSEALVPPNYLTISSLEPGNITISRAGNILLNLKNGKIIKPTSNIFEKGPVSIFFKEAKNRIYNDVLKTLKSDKYNPEGFDDYPKGEYINYLQRIIFNIRQKNHGGTIIIVPDYMNNDDSRLIDRVSIKYLCNYDLAWKLIVDSLAINRKYHDLYFTLWSGKTELSVENFQELSILNSCKEDTEDALSDSVKFIASLSGVDGAVILTDKLRVLGFGAEIISLTPSLKEVKIVTEASGIEGRYTSIDNFGTRHRSAFRFCSSYEESIAIIISQDGGIKAVKCVGPDLILWPDINVGFYGI